MRMFVSKMIRITSGTWREAEREKPIYLRAAVCVFLYAHMEAKKKKAHLWKVSPGSVRAEETGIIHGETEIETKKRVKAHTPSPPVAFLPGVFVNHPF